ncbi:MAG: hypothetical protein R2771_09310 [Saprospiraceae bacterium]
MYNPATSKPAYRGFITFGSPHQGVVAADNLANPAKVEKALNDLCINVAYPIALDAIEEYSGFWNNVISWFTSPSIGNYVCENVVIPVAVWGIENFIKFGVEPQLTTDYVQTEVAPMITENNAVFYGIENKQI